MPVERFRRQLQLRQTLQIVESLNKGEIIMPASGKCEHEICTCPTSGDAEYCSDHCREAEDQDIVEIKCDCGCPSCG